MGCTLIAVTPEEKQTLLTGFSFSGWPEVEKEQFFTLSSVDKYGVATGRTPEMPDALGDYRVQIEHVRDSLVQLYTQLASVSNAYSADVEIIHGLPEGTTIFIGI